MYHGPSLNGLSETATNMLQAVAGHLSIEAKMSLLLRSFPNKKQKSSSNKNTRMRCHEFSGGDVNIIVYGNIVHRKREHLTRKLGTKFWKLKCKHVIYGQRAQCI